MQTKNKQNPQGGRLLIVNGDINPYNPSLPNTLWVGVWIHKHLLKRLLGVPNTYSQGIWGILED